MRAQFTRSRRNQRADQRLIRGNFGLDIHAQWAPGSPAGPHVAWARTARQVAARGSAGGGYVNFIGADQGADRVRAAYGGNYARLAQVKATYDPDNFFHVNNNIAPASAAGNGGRDGS